MSFKRKDMHIFSQRCKAYMASLQNLREEGAKLTAIYFNEAGGGSDAEFVDTAGISKQEHVDAVTLFMDLQEFCENGDVATADRQAAMTPFLHNG